MSTKKPAAKGSSGTPPPAKGPSPSSAAQAAAPAGSIGIGIETEFYLDPRRGKFKDIEQFANSMVQTYDQFLGRASFPRMVSLVHTDNKFTGPSGTRHTLWALHSEVTVETMSAPWGIELASPIFFAYPKSGWRAQVEKMWEFLTAEYRVTADEECSTHVHLSLTGGYTLTQLKRLAQAVVYFEPAVERIVPETRRNNEYARSNWIDNRHLAYKKLSRADSMRAIEACKSDADVIELMNPGQDRYFGFNFLPLKTYRTIEFRRGSGSTNVGEVFRWVEFAVRFLQASMGVARLEDFQKFKSNVGGLKQFLNTVPNQAGMNDRAHMDTLFRGCKDDDKLEPKIVNIDKLPQKKKDKLNKKIAEDKKGDPMLVKIGDALAR